MQNNEPQMNTDKHRFEISNLKSICVHPCSSVVSILLFVSIAVGASVARADFRFVHISDPHVGAGENHLTDAKLFKEIIELDPKPAFVVATGDICEIGTAAQYAQFQEALKSLTVPMYVAPGNHDVRWNPIGKEGFVKGVGQPMNQSWDYENVHFVTLDSTVLLEHWGHISQDQLDWLKADLEKVGAEKPVVIGFHHPIGREGTTISSGSPDRRTRYR